MKNYILLFFVLLSSFLSGQYIIKDAEELKDLKKLPQEKVYMHHTGPAVLSGEYLNYSFYCFNTQSNRLSNISQIGYVVLVNEKNEYVLEQKIRLSKGLSAGDFFVGTSIPSGNYKILGYTQWMKNNGLKQVFKDDIVVINPYLADQSGLIQKSEKDFQGTNNPELEKDVDSAIIQLNLDKYKFKPREKVKLSLRNYKGQLGYGTYTIKVIRRTEFPISSSMTSIDYAKSYFNVAKEIQKNIGDSLFLPEQRGELVFGSVINEETLEPIENSEVVISVPGKEFLLKFANTDKDGNFYTYLREDYKEPRVIVQINQTNRDAIVELKSNSKLELKDLDFGSFQLDSKYADLINKRSIHNQIENQFFSVKPDSLILDDPIDPFDGGIPETLVLDEYTRFKTFQETLVELFQFAGYRKNKGGVEYIRVAQDFETYNEVYNDYPAIVLIDGVFIPNHGEIKGFDAHRIKEISLIRDQFRLGGRDYQGMLVVETFDNDFFQDYDPILGLNKTITKPLTPKSYYVQKYEAEGTTFLNVPDYRRLLLWEPSVEFETSSMVFEFFTSDVTGEFEVVLDGFTTYGKPIYLKEKIMIE